MHISQFEQIDRGGSIFYLSLLVIANEIRSWNIWSCAESHLDIEKQGCHNNAVTKENPVQHVTDGRVIQIGLWWKHKEILQLWLK